MDVGGRADPETVAGRQESPVNGHDDVNAEEPPKKKKKSKQVRCPCSLLWVFQLTTDTLSTSPHSKSGKSQSISTSSWVSMCAEMGLVPTHIVFCLVLTLHTASFSLYTSRSGVLHWYASII